MTEKSTVRSVTYGLLRSLGLTVIFGDPGSTEQPFLQEFPDDFTYVLALQEASAIAMADAFAQVTRRPALVNLHSSAGLGNALGNLVAAYHGNTPLIVTSGQQHRELVIGEPYLGNREAITMPKPWVKWSYEPARAQDVPEAFMRAYAMALQPPAGPVYLSVPMDDWKQPMPGPARVRSVSDRVAPDAERLRLFADRISASRHPALVFGPEVDRSGGWEAAIALAEKLRAPVYGSPLLDRASFRPVVGLIGDGSFQYSVQALWTAAQHRLPVVYVVMRNNEYSILKSFAVLEETPGVPGLDLPGLDIATVARGFGCRAADAGTTEELEREFKAALSADTPTVIVVATQPQKAML
jgi:thiamine pyrophosphate-dependent acetolactate synthase large subunit-like protein